MPAMIAWVLAGLARLFASRIGQWVTSALVFLGLELATSQVVVAPLLAQIQSVAGAVGTGAVWLGFFNIDRYITIILSAYAVGAGKSAILRRRAAP